MTDNNMDLDVPHDELPNWHEEPTTREWARVNLQRSPPPFGSSERMQLHELLREHKKRILELREVEQQIKAQLAPVRLMPPEILSQVFILAVPDSFAFAEDKWPRNAILSVCSRWRNIALRTQELWCRFHLDKLVDTKALRDPRRANTEQLLEWMKRAGNGPWDVRMFEGPYNFHVWRCVLQQIAHWRSWQYCGDEFAVWHFLLSAKFATNLKSLRLTGFASEGNNVSINKACAERLQAENEHNGGKLEFPNLRQLHVYGTAREIIRYLTGPRCEDLILGNPTERDLDDAARGFPNTKSISVIKLRPADPNPSAPPPPQTSDPSSTPPVPPSPLVDCSPAPPFSKVTVCEWVATPAEPLNAEILASKLPNLETLRIAYSLSCINHTPLPSVTTLELIANAGIGSSSLREFFKLFNNTRRLLLQNNSWATSVLIILASPLTEGGWLLPLLEEVAIVGIRLDQGALTSFANTRCRHEGGGRVKCVVSMTNCEFEERYSFGKQNLSVQRGDYETLMELR